MVSWSWFVPVCSWNDTLVHTTSVAVALETPELPELGSWSPELSLVRVMWMEGVEMEGEGDGVDGDGIEEEDEGEDGGCMDVDGMVVGVLSEGTDPLGFVEWVFMVENLDVVDVDEGPDGWVEFAASVSSVMSSIV